MNIRNFPSCCNAVILFDFPGAHGINGSKTYTKRSLSAYKRDYRGQILVAMTKDAQVESEQALAEAGFSCTERMFVGDPEEEGNTPRLKLWWYGLTMDGETE